MSSESVFVFFTSAHRCAKAHTAHTRASADDIFKAIKGTAANKQYVGGVDLDQLLLWPIACTVGGNRCGLALEYFQQSLLHAFAGDIARCGWRATLACNFVDLVDANDASGGLFDIAASSSEQCFDYAFDVFADIAGFGERGRISDGKRHVEFFGQGLSQQGFARTGRSNKQNIAFLQLDVTCLAAHPNTFVVVVHGDCHGAFSFVLTNNVSVKFVDNLSRWRILWTLRRFFLRQDIVAQLYTFIANEDAWPTNELAHFFALLTAE